MGEKYSEGVVLDLERMWEESGPRTPLICFLSMGSDPTDSIIALGKRLKFETRYVSMGQGQEVHARKLLQQTMANVSQGCELSLLFLHRLMSQQDTRFRQPPLQLTGSLFLFMIHHDNLLLVLT